MAKKNKRKAAFGDFQTPLPLAKQVAEKVFQLEASPACVLEPTCGKGTLLFAVSQCLPASSCTLVGFELNGLYLKEAEKILAQEKNSARLHLHHKSFFEVEWDLVLQEMPDPIVVLGNPPWVTNADLGQLDIANLPEKSNFQKHLGIEAITGKGNFDISEWMSISLLEALRHRHATFAFLLKSSVARKVLEHAWGRGFKLNNLSIHKIDAKSHFDASVDACLFMCQTHSVGPQRCAVYSNLSAKKEEGSIGFSQGKLIANMDTLSRAETLLASSDEDEWRSGIKHDCAKILELRRDDDKLRNKLNEELHLETEWLFPLLKSSDVAKSKTATLRYLLLTQKKPSDDTSILAHTTPKTWAYLCRHQALFNKRKSSIYKNKTAFSIFGVGDYTFAPWKVAISGLYKNLRFTVVPPQDGKPVVFDDTVYFTPCQTEAEATLKAELLNSPLVREFFLTYVFLDAKRPITAQLLKRLSLRKVAKKLGRLEEYEACIAFSK